MDAKCINLAHGCNIFYAKLISLEKKQDKHNNLIERMVRVEDSAKSAHHRLDSLEDIIK